MEETSTNASREVGGLAFAVDEGARSSWDAVMLARDINRARLRYEAGGEGASEAAIDAMALSMEYVMMTTDLTRERLSAHLGAGASFADVSAWLGQAIGAIASKN